MNDHVPPQMSNLVSDYKPDILDTISNLSNDEVFTPPALANSVLDLLPPEVWTDPEIRFLDPFCKTGIFLRESAKRLMVGLEAAIPDAAERRRHIFRNQLYGCAITELTWLMSRRSLYGTKDASSEIAGYLTARMDRPEGNIIFPRREHDWDRNGKCRTCGIGEEIEREGRENHAYALIHGGIEEEFRGMQFDVIIGNPPYQVKDGGHGASATPIYHKFVQAAKEMRPRFLSMIIPARWYAGGKGLDEFRAEMLQDPGMSKLIDIRDATEAFAGVEIKGGVCYFLHESGKKEHGCEVRGMRSGAMGAPAVRRLDEHDVLIRDNEAISILKKVLDRHQGGWLSETVSSRKPFGFPTNFTDFSKTPFAGAIKIYAKGDNGWVDRARVPDEHAWVDKWKVLINAASSNEKEGPGMKMANPAIVAEPGACCTETFLLVEAFDSEIEARNMADYLKTRFVRFMISLRKNTQHLSKERFAFVPVMPMAQPWTDDRLYSMFGIGDHEQEFIHLMIREIQ